MDKATLTRGGAGPAGLPQDTVDLVIDGETVTVTVRAMNRGELVHGGKLSNTKGQIEVERYLLSACMIDPVMTLEDVDAWMNAGAALEIQPVVEKINELSGIAQGADKSDVHSDGDRPVD